MLEIKNLHAEIEGKSILNGINLKIKPGEIHALMGPNGSGKSTLSKVLMGHPHYKVTKGKILLGKKDITSQDPSERSAMDSLSTKYISENFTELLDNHGDKKDLCRKLLKELLTYN